MSRGIGLRAFRLLPTLVAAGILASSSAFASAAKLDALIGRAESRAAKLRARLGEIADSGGDISLPDATLAVAELFIIYTTSDKGDPSMHDRAERSISHVIRRLDAELEEAGRALDGRTSYPRVPDWDVTDLRVRDGGIFSGADPVFLTGFNWSGWHMAQKSPKRLARLGANLVDGITPRPADIMKSMEDARVPGPDGYLERARANNFAADYLQRVEPPPWLVAAHPDIRDDEHGHYTWYVIDHPAFARMQEVFADRYARRAAQHSNLFAVDLFNEPGFTKAPAPTMKNWRAWLRDRYRTVEAMNGTWGASFPSFDAIEAAPGASPPGEPYWKRGGVDFGVAGMRGMYYDWCVYNKERTTAFFRRTHDAIRRHAPNVNTHVKMMMHEYFNGSTEHRGWGLPLTYNNYGIDAEAVSDMSTVLGCDMSMNSLMGAKKHNRFHGVRPYAVSWLNHGLVCDFFKSIGPDKPVYNSEWHIVEAVDETEIGRVDEAHMNVTMWLGHLHGMCANIVWYWGRGHDGAPLQQGKGWFGNSLLEQPWLLDAYARQTLTLRRFVPQVMSFANETPQVRLLYSDASAIQEVKCVDALRDAYEALNFLGVRIGFVTERQLAANGIPRDTRLVIVPDVRYSLSTTVPALRTAARRGVRLGIVGAESFSRDPHGKARGDRRIRGAWKIPVASPESYHAAFDTWLSSCRTRRHLTARDANGKPAWGVEVRTASHGRERMAYLVNLLKEPVDVKLDWSRRGNRLVDLVTGRTVSDRVTIQPREVIFGTCAHR